jgi:hypothetical protein
VRNISPRCRIECKRRIGTRITCGRTRESRAADTVAPRRKKSPCSRQGLLLGRDRKWRTFVSLNSASRSAHFGLPAIEKSSCWNELCISGTENLVPQFCSRVR